MEALEVSNLGRVASLDQSLKAFLDERSQPAAEHRLLAKKITFGFFFEGRLQNARARRSDPIGIAERVFVGAAAGILMNCQQGRHASAFCIDAPQQMPRAL